MTQRSTEIQTMLGKSTMTNLRANLSKQMLRMARFRRRQEPGLIVHLDRVSQYCCSYLFQSTLNAYGMITSYRMRFPIQF